MGEAGAQHREGVTRLDRLQHHLRSKMNLERKG